MKYAFYTALAILAFAANSIFCRLALLDSNIDAASFTAIRLISGALTLVILSSLFTQKINLNFQAKSLLPSFYLFTYAATFSFAYIVLDTATGAIILFASVQITMIVSSLIKGNKLTKLECLGATLAISGFIALLLPSAQAPSITGLILMTIAGLAWGLYSIAGMKSSAAIANTASNFLLTLPLVVLLLLLFSSELFLSWQGIIYGLLSGIFASGIGYSLWYFCLPKLSATLAAIVQLLVPVIASLIGLLYEQQAISQQVIISFAFIGTGILSVIFAKRYDKKGQ